MNQRIVFNGHRKHPKNCKTLLREHLIRCWGVKLFLLKDSFKYLSLIKFCYNLPFFNFVLIWLFYCHNLIFLVLSPLELLSFVIYNFFYNLCFYVLSKIELFSFVKIKNFEFCHNEFLSFVTIFFFEFCHNLIFF